MAKIFGLKIFGHITYFLHFRLLSYIYISCSSIYPPPPIFLPNLRVKFAQDVGQLLPFSRLVRLVYNWLVLTVCSGNNLTIMSDIFLTVCLITVNRIHGLETR